MAEITYEIPKKLLYELLAVCEAATFSEDELKAEAATNRKAVLHSIKGWQAAECWRWLRALRDGAPFQPQPFEAVHCAKCGDRTDTGEAHDCGEEE